MEFGVWSLVPPVLTIALALTTKNVFISLLIGILTGNLVLNHFAVFTGLNAGIYSILDTMTEQHPDHRLCTDHSSSDPSGREVRRY
jgi:tetracycline resistance efflux pump